MVKQLFEIFSIIALLVIFLFGTAAAGSHKGYSAKTSVADLHFSDLDKDGNDAVSREEFAKQFPGMASNAFDVLDKDKDGTLNHDEWHAFKEMHKGMGDDHKGMASYHGKEKFHKDDLPDPSGFNAHFPNMDANGDGVVDLSEFKAHFSDQKDAEAVFNAVDLNKNGSLDHDEWHAFKKAHGLGHIE